MDAVKHLFRRKRKPKVPSNVSITHNEAQSSTSSLEETSVHPVAVEEVSAARLETLTGEGDTKVVLNTLERIRDWLDQGMNITSDVSEAGPIPGSLGLACSSILTGLEIAKEAQISDLTWRDMIEDITSHARRMEEDITRYSKDYPKMAGDEDLVAAMEEYNKSIKAILIETNQVLSQYAEGSFGPDMKRICVEKENIERLRRYERISYQSFQNTLNSISQVKAKHAIEVVEAVDSEVAQARTEMLRAPTKAWAHVTDGFSSAALLSAYGTDVETCEPGTRVDVLARIRRWAEDTSSPNQVFWLKDSAGTGKSTIAATMAREWQNNRRLAGRFFFSPNVATNQRTVYFCRIVAIDIITNLPRLEPIIEPILLSSPENLAFPTQFRRLITEPLKQAEASDGQEWEAFGTNLEETAPLLLVFDALDNCVPKDQRILLATLLEELPRVPRVKVLLTSRDFQSISSYLQNSSLVCGHDVQLLDMSNPPLHDITLYVDSKLRGFSEEERKRVITQANGLFVWAATFCRAVSNIRMRARLLENMSRSDVADTLDKLYLSILNQALVDPSAKGELRKVLQVIVCAFQPISSNTVTTFLPKIHQVDDFVQDLTAVLKDGHPDRPIKVLHPTFREFIASNEGRANGFLLQMEPSHTVVALACLDVLERTLRQDIFGVVQPNCVLPRNVDVGQVSDMVQSKTSAALRYASSYWAYHIAASENAWDDWERVSTFLNHHFLHWVELMSWRGELNESLRALSQLGSQIRTRPRMAGTVTEIVCRHAIQFILRFHDLVADSALHTYTIPLAILPLDSPVLPLAKDVARHHPVNYVTIDNEDDWSTITLIGERAGFAQVRISEESSRIVTVGGKGSLRLWDSKTGAHVGTPVLEPRKPDWSGTHLGVSHALFSPDGAHLAFIYAERMGGTCSLHLWESQTGDPLWDLEIKTDFQPESYALKVQFLPYKSQLAAVLPYETESLTLIVFVDFLTGKKLEYRMYATLIADNVAVSPDGRKGLFVGHRLTNHKTTFLELFDMDGLKKITELEVKLACDATLVHFSSDGSIVALSSKETTSREGGTYPCLLLDCETGDPIQLTRGDNPPCHTVRFAPEGSLFASLVLTRSEIIVWDLREGKKLRTITGHGKRMKDAWFSRDSRRIAGLSDEHEIKVWDISTGEEKATFFQGYIPAHRSITLSPDWRTLLYLYGYGEVRVYDVTSGARGVSTPRIKSTFSGRGTFAPDDNVFIALYQTDQEHWLTLWDTNSGSARNMARLGPCREDLVDMSVSPDNTELVCYFYKGPTTFYSLKTYQQLSKVLEKEHFPSRSCGIFFSQCGEFLGLTRGDCIQIWEYRTGKLVWESNCGSWFVVSLSPDATHIFGRHSHGQFERLYICRLRDSHEMTIQEQITPLATAFIPQSDLVVAINMSEIEVWQLRPSEIIHLYTVRHQSIPSSGRRWRLGFSLDKRFMVYGSLIWTVEESTLKPYVGDTVPLSLSNYPHSFLTYQSGWICSAFPRGKVLPVPYNLQPYLSLMNHWTFSKTKLLLWADGNSPIVIDCSGLLA